MKTLSKTAARTLDKITADMPIGTVRHIGPKDGPYMQVVVEHLRDNSYTVSHYYTQNGDLVPDPDVEFLRLDTGAWLPVSITQWAGSRRAVQVGPDGRPEGIYPSALRDLCSFTTTWMRNINRQQDLKNIPAAK